MYEFLKGFHNLLRWVIAFGGIFAVIVMLRGFASNVKWGGTERIAASVFTYSLHTQLLTGIILYVITPLLTAGMSARLSGRLLLVEHAGTMILAVVAAQLGTSLARRAKDDKDKFTRALLGYAVALVFIAWATPWGRNLIPWV